MATPCRPGVRGGKKTCYSAKLYRALKALAEKECRGNDMDLARSAGKKNRAVADAARACIRPEMPAAWRTSPHAWLSNHELDAVMAQYAGAYPDFEYLGTHPSDFMSTTSDGRCVSSHCDRVWARKRRLYGSIVNLDLHTQRGSHWVGLVLDCRKANAPVAYYYDSVGNTYPRSLEPFFASCRRQFKGRALAHFLEHSAVNTRQHQKGNTECGMHALQFMDAMVQGQSFEAYCAEDHHDTQVFEKRMLFFSR
jgi:hypothetical protein